MLRKVNSSVFDHPRNTSFGKWNEFIYISLNEILKSSFGTVVKIILYYLDPGINYYFIRST